jgi:hypothetical protein
MSSAVTLTGFVSEQPNKKTAKEYRRDAQRLYWALQNWEAASLEFGKDKAGWEREVISLTKLKREFIDRWGWKLLEEEQGRIYIRLAAIKMAEPVPVYIPQDATQEKKEVVVEERRRRRRVSKHQLRRHFRLCY